MEGLFLFSGVILALIVFFLLKKIFPKEKSYDLEQSFSSDEIDNLLRRLGDKPDLKERSATYWYKEPQLDEDFKSEKQKEEFPIEPVKPEKRRIKVALLPQKTNTGKRKIIMGVIVSAVILIAALYIILSQQFDDTNQKWAFSTVGAILGYWLNS
jgi:hypothetical protein